jgi:hypothetical protein
MRRANGRIGLIENLCMKMIDWTALYERYKGHWVALSEGDNETVVGYALDQAQRKGCTSGSYRCHSGDDHLCVKHLSAS